MTYFMYIRYQINMQSMKITKILLNKLIFKENGTSIDARFYMSKLILKKNPAISNEELMRKVSEVFPTNYWANFFKLRWLICPITILINSICLNKISIKILWVNEIFFNNLFFLNYFILIIKWGIFYILNCCLTAYILKVIAIFTYRLKSLFEMKK